MSPTIRRTVGLVLIWLVGLTLATSAVMKLFGVAGDNLLRGQLIVLLRPLGVIEFTSAALLLVPVTRRLGLLLCTAYLGGAMAWSIAGYGLLGLPPLTAVGQAIPAAVIQAMLWTGATLRTPDLLGPLLVGEPAEPRGPAVPTRATPGGTP